MNNIIYPLLHFNVGVLPKTIRHLNFSHIGSYTFCTALITSLTLGTSLTVGTAYAEDYDDAVLETITVTAEKRERTIFEIASSVSAKSAEFLQDAEIYSVTELSQHIPNLQIFSWGGRRDTNIFIRGIGPGLFTDPTVGFYVDGINYSNNGAFDMDLMDIEHIEVLRGPQGTLYGGHSLAGIINIVTRQPTDETEGRISLSYDDLTRRKLTGSFSTPINETLFFGSAVSIHKADGYIDNLYNNEDFGQRDDISARTKLRWLPNDKLDATLTLDYENFSGDSYAMGPYDDIIKEPQQIDHDYIGKDIRDTLGLAVTVNWRGDSINFTSITSRREWESVNSADQDGGSMPGFSYHTLSKEDHTQVTQELRWSPQNPGEFDWIFGLYAYTAEFNVNNHNQTDFSAMGMGGASEQFSNNTRENKGYAVFGQVDYDITKQLVLTAGLRLDHEEREAFVNQAPQSNDPTTKFDGSRDFNEILPKVAISYATKKNSLLYASVSQGYRAGGFDTVYPNLDNPTYDSEYSTNYEIGYKSRLLEDSLEITGALFLIDIKDQQVQQLFPTTGSIVTDNAGKSQSTGVEFESRYRPSDSWLFSLSGNYTNAEFKEYSAVNFATYAMEDYSGLSLPNTPQWTINVSVQHRHALGDIGGLVKLEWFTQVDSQHIDAYYFDAPNKLKQNAYNLLNLKTGIEAENWQAYIWVKNSLDEYYSKVEFNFGFGRTTEAAQPRSIGVSLNYSF
jgi:iron complex outermembrane receptor protein